MGARALLLEAVRSEGFNPRSQRIVLQRLKPLLHRLRPGPRALLLEAVWSEGFNPRSQLAVLQRLKPLLHRLRPGSPQSPDCGRNHLSDTTIDRSLSHPRPRLPPVVNCAFT